MRVTPAAAIPASKFAARRPTPVSFNDFVQEISKKAYVVKLEA